MVGSQSTIRVNLPFSNSKRPSSITAYRTMGISVWIFSAVSGVQHSLHTGEVILSICSLLTDTEAPSEDESQAVGLNRAQSVHLIVPRNSESIKHFLQYSTTRSEHTLAGHHLRKKRYRTFIFKTDRNEYNRQARE